MNPEPSEENPEENPSAAAGGGGSLLLELATLAAILLVGFVLTVLNADLPIVRNSLLYAQTAASIMDDDWDPRPTAADNEKNYGRPVFFSLLAALFIEHQGPNVGVKSASYLGTALFAIVTLVFLRLAAHRAGFSRRWVPVTLALLFFNPLILYQFWSAYPDGLFGALTLSAFMLTDRVAQGKRRGVVITSLMLGAVIYIAYHTKLYGLVLGLACPLTIGVGWLLTRAEPGFQRWAWPSLSVTFVLLGTMVLCATAGYDPLLSIGGTDSKHSSGMKELAESLDGRIVGPTILVIASWIMCLWMTFGVTLLFLAARRKRCSCRWSWRTFAVVYLLGLIPFGTEVVYNMRYVIPVLPFAAVAVARGMDRMQNAKFRRNILIVHALIATVACLHYNWRPAFERLESLEDRFFYPYANAGDRLDNLRMRHHVNAARQIERINLEAEPDGAVFWVHDYYKDAYEELVEDMGLRPDIDVRYEEPETKWIPDRGKALVAQDVSDPEEARAWHREFEDDFHVTALGNEVIRVSPRIEVSVTELPDSDAERGTLVLLSASIPAEREEGERVEFRINNKVVGLTWEPPYEVRVPVDRRGRHVAFARLISQRGKQIKSLPVAFHIGREAYEFPILYAADDAEEEPGESTYLHSSDLEMVEDAGQWDYQLSALRFRRLPFASGVKIKNAYIQFSAAARNDEPTELVFQAEDSGHSPSLVEVKIADRKSGAASVTWQPKRWHPGRIRSRDQRSPDIAALVQEVLDHPGWQAGNALTVIVSGSGVRVAHASDGAKRLWETPTLYVELEPPESKESNR